MSMSVNTINGDTLSGLASRQVDELKIGFCV